MDNVSLFANHHASLDGRGKIVHHSQQQKDLAYAALLLERQIESYQLLHEEELAAIRAALAELKRQILSLAPPAEASAPNQHETPASGASEEQSQRQGESP